MFDIERGWNCECEGAAADATEFALAVLEDAVSAGAIVGFEIDDDEDEAEGGMVVERCGAAAESLLDADLEGPSRAATCAERVTKDLYWYLA